MLRTKEGYHAAIFSGKLRGVFASIYSSPEIRTISSNPNNNGDMKALAQQKLLISSFLKPSKLSIF